MDYRTDTREETWLPRLEGVSVVVNTVGVLRDSVEKPMARLHADTPVALFSACATAGVKRVVHLSALGVDRGVDTAYFSTRLAAETHLQRLPNSMKWLVLRPSLIYGDDGASARMFRLLARLPIHVLPMNGQQPLQPVHIDDLCESVVRWLDDPNANSQTVATVGSESTTLRGMLDSYRMQMERPAALHLATPACLMKLAARAGDHIAASPLCSDTLTMLLAGNTASDAEFAALLGRAPTSYQTFIQQGVADECA
jgi:uncharacterized protein YbjT (DUF2867 family)